MHETLAWNLFAVSERSLDLQRLWCNMDTNSHNGVHREMVSTFVMTSFMIVKTLRYEMKHLESHKNIRAESLIIGGGCGLLFIFTSQFGKFWIVLFSACPQLRVQDAKTQTCKYGRHGSKLRHSVLSHPVFPHGSAFEYPRPALLLQINCCIKPHLGSLIFPVQTLPSLILNLSGPFEHFSREVLLLTRKLSVAYPYQLSIFDQKRYARVNCVGFFILSCILNCGWVFRAPHGP